MSDTDTLHTEAEALLTEAQWLEDALTNGADKGHSPEFLQGFAAAAGWVRFHAEHPYLIEGRRRGHPTQEATEEATP